MGDGSAAGERDGEEAAKTTNSQQPTGDATHAGRQFDGNAQSGPESAARRSPLSPCCLKAFEVLLGIAWGLWAACAAKAP